MKIIWITNLFNIHGYRCLSKLDEFGYNTHVITFYEKEIPSEIKNLKRINYHFYRMNKLKNLKSDVFLRTKNLHVKLLNNIGFYKFIKKCILNIKPDIIQADWLLDVGFFAALSGFHPFILIPLGSDILIRPKKRVVDKIKVRYAIKKADMIACDCIEVRDKIVNRFSNSKKEVSVFPWGINLKKFKPSYDNKFKNNLLKKYSWEHESKILIMTRNMQHIYDIETFIKAMACVCKKAPYTKAILIGTGPLLKDMKSITYDLGLQNNVKFLGYIENDKLPLYLNACDIYVSSSLSDGTSLSLLEAMACALPVVVTSIPANQEWIKDGINGYLFPTGDQNLLYKRIIDLLINENEVKNFGSKNYRIACEKANWDKNFEILESMYNKLTVSK